jgi:hypothetical protein
MHILRSRVALILATLSMLLMVTGSVSAQQASPAATSTGLAGAVASLLTHQADDGGFLGFTGESDAGFTIDAIIALVAASNHGVESGDAIQRAVEFLGTGDAVLVYAQAGVGQSAKLILGLKAAGVEPEGFANVMPLGIIQQGQNAETGIYGTGLYDHAYAMMALSAMGEEVPETAMLALANTQADNGGWAWDASTDVATVDSNTTSMVVQALVASGHTENDMTSNAFDYLTTTVSEAGAVYAVAAGTPVDANSTALVAQAYLAVGEDASGLVASLSTFQNSSGGLFYNVDDKSDNPFATVQGIPPMAGQAFPILPAAIPAPTPVTWHDLAAA